MGSVNEARRAGMKLAAAAALATAAIAGAAIGLVASQWLSRYVASLLFEVTATDPASYALAAAVLLGVALAASILAGRRATALDVTSVLRYE